MYAYAHCVLDVFHSLINKVTPVIDTINDKTMEYANWVSRIPAVGTFPWSPLIARAHLQDHGLHVEGWCCPARRQADRSYRVRLHVIVDCLTFSTSLITSSPTMAGGLFSVERNYFYEIGGYDEVCYDFRCRNVRKWMVGEERISKSPFASGNAV